MREVNEEVTSIMEKVAAIMLTIGGIESVSLINSNIQEISRAIEQSIVDVEDVMIGPVMREILNSFDINDKDFIKVFAHISRQFIVPYLDDDQLAKFFQIKNDKWLACLLLREVCGLENHDVSLILGIPPGSIMSSFFRAKSEIGEF